MKNYVGEYAKKAILYDTRLEKPKAIKYYSKASTKLEEIIQANPESKIVNIYKDRLYSYRKRISELKMGTF